MENNYDIVFIYKELGTSNVLTEIKFRNVGIDFMLIENKSVWDGAVDEYLKKLNPK